MQLTSFAPLLGSSITSPIPSDAADASEDASVSEETTGAAEDSAALPAEAPEEEAGAGAADASEEGAAEAGSAEDSAGLLLAGASEEEAGAQAARVSSKANIRTKESDRFIRIPAFCHNLIDLSSRFFPL